ncbi:MAG: hypothetical protein GQ569_07910 [Methylococcaceae bacterium]|nr:hypothetical protein [Methylococcaceae bacterium]
MNLIPKVPKPAKPKPKASWFDFTDAFTLIDWIALGLVFALICLLIYVIWRRKHPKNNDKASSSAMDVPEKVLLASNSLSKVWRSFVSNIPWRLRSGALAVPVSLVIGEAGSGKTEIINRYTAWQGQDFRFHPSAINDSLLQIYQGAKALVLEFSSSLLYDTHPATYRAMKKLWRRLPTNLQAVVVIDATTLLEPDPERLRLSGQALSGKLKVFNELDGSPLPLTITLSHMEKVQGFVEFCTFLETTNIPLQIEFPKKDGINRLSSCLEDFEPHLSRALLSCSAQDYLKIVNFLNEAPRLLGVLSEFLHLADLGQSPSSNPIIRLCLLSKEIHSFKTQPFALQPNYIAQSPFKLDYHAKAALILLLLGFGYFGGSYYFQKSLIRGVMENIKTVRRTPINLYPEKISPLFLDFSADLNKNPLLSFQPNFFPNMVGYSNLLLIREIRSYYLIPMLEKAQFESDSIYKSIKLLAIFYGTPDNDMGKLVLEQLQSKPTDYMIKHRLLIDEYINNNTHLQELNRPLNGLNYTLSKSYNDIYELLISTLHTFELILEKQSMDESELSIISQNTSELLKFMDELNSHTHERMMMNWLVENTGLEINLRTYSRQQTELRQKPMQDLLRLVGSINISDENDCATALSINQCIKKIQGIAEAKTNIDDVSMKFTLSGDYFSYHSKQWSDLIQRQRLTMLMRNTMRSHKNNNGWIFFNTPSFYPNREMNATNNGDILFSGKARIDGRLSADAFEKDVKPAIMALSEVIAKLPVDKNDKSRFTKYILNNLRIYSDRYINAHYNYFQHLKVSIKSAWELNYVLEQLQQPNSPLLQALIVIKENTALKLSESPHFGSFTNKLRLFSFVQRLMQEKEGIYPEFQKYQFIISQMHMELSSTEPYLAKDPNEKAASLKGAITPMGRVAWGMLLNEDGSYSKLVKNWLLNAGIPKNWQQPFLAPVQKVAALGTAEIKTTIDGIWLDIWDSSITPLLVKFPFAPNAGDDKELSLDELNKTFHPTQGVFWGTFQQYLAPLYKFNNGIWMERQELVGRLKLPTDTLKRVNAAQQLTNHLWDDKGTPKPLEVSVKAGLLPTFDTEQIPNAPLVSLNYLREGAISVLGFNQQVVWQKLALEWWTPQLAEVGMEFRKDESPTRVYSNISVSNSQWNFFRLLQRGQSAGNNNYQWSLAHPEFPKQPLNLEFTFKSVPWAVFTNLAGS